MLSKTRFFFTKNSFVLKSLAQSRGCRLSIASGFKLKNFNFWPNTMKSSRFYSTTSISAEGAAKISESAAAAAATAVKNETKKVISNKIVAYWLMGTSGLVFGIVVLGGLTRLTESGLSITEWKPVTGAIPPLNEKEWEEEFEKYKNSPEFKQLNSHITLEEFKFIFSMEWGHRLMGRGIGMFFILPALFFWKTGRFSPHITRRVIGLTGLLGLQGAIGWWMVKSGLDEEQLAARKSKPTVSQYRLTTHLGAAFLMYLGVLWTAFEILNENKLVKQAQRAPEIAKDVMAKLTNPSLKPVRVLATGLLVLAFATAMSGGMVAGLDAGLIYNTFPHMGDDYIPSASELMDPVYARKEDKSDMVWRNLLENPTTVQLVHRIFATTTFFAILAAHSYVNRRKAFIPKPVTRSMHGVMGAVTLQVALGITTLIYLVPISLGAAHQAGALVLLTACLAFSAKLKKPRPEVISYINTVMKNQLLKAKV
ncbi:Cytochrome c oxidase assembly protein COX15 [Scheffersomyces stipitis CBS 6054]|uniref:Cytochrome c oxidase assembly protein COX15 n=1 Tax=Scheffersomyces stipitis (strain ATCC 58785 / CBS 6054 / NBRC 10063 / NRRL Y-11545) TaxID=322104 RepID=A3LUY5_PICST|nr:Cytochrome c oxidase assembly protein COX15 [Scheffersomyces stipitis CBS 6054]ABN66676.2 Cytochrome c oxidase assembly protein COX15 [Scheffersomyces stipitis CBS 6054]